MYSVLCPHLLMTPSIRKQKTYLNSLSGPCICSLDAQVSVLILEKYETDISFVDSWHLYRLISGGVAVHMLLIHNLYPSILVQSCNLTQEKIIVHKASGK